jgi:hypothetical protein
VLLVLSWLWWKTNWISRILDDHESLTIMRAPSRKSFNRFRAFIRVLKVIRAMIKRNKILLRYRMFINLDTYSEQVLDMGKNWGNESNPRAAG